MVALLLKAAFSVVKLCLPDAAKTLEDYINTRILQSVVSGFPGLLKPYSGILRRLGGFRNQHVRDAGSFCLRGLPGPRVYDH